MTNVPHNPPPQRRDNAAQAGDTLHRSCTGQSSRQNCPNTHSGLRSLFHKHSEQTKVHYENPLTASKGYLVEGLRENYIYVLFHLLPDGYSSFVPVLPSPLLSGPSLQAPCLSATRNKLHNCIEAAAITVLFYDHLVTFAEETAYIWARRKHASAILFLVNRYLGCFSTIAQAVMTFATVSPERCIQYIHCRQVLLVVNHATVCILFILRTYALYGRNNRLLTLLILTSITLASVVAWSLVGQQATTATDVPGCQMIYNTKTAIHFAVSYEALCVFDTLIFGLTMYKTSKVGVQSSGHSKPDLVVLLLRDGAIYFGIVAFANLANIVSFYAAPELLKGGLSTFSICIAITMVSRLMLNLHKTADTGIFSHRQHVTNGRGTLFTSQVPELERGWDLSTIPD